MKEGEEDKLGKQKQGKLIEHVSYFFLFYPFVFLSVSTLLFLPHLGHVLQLLLDSAKGMGKRLPLQARLGIAGGNELRSGAQVSQLAFLNE
jgi:hypothetical protein